MSAFTRVVKPAASGVQKLASASGSILKNVGKEFAKNAFSQAAFNSKGIVRYGELSRTPTPTFLRPITPSGTPKFQEFAPIETPAFQTSPSPNSFRPITPSSAALMGGKIRRRRQTRRNLRLRKRNTRRRV
jgi:hypothetical protein